LRAKASERAATPTPRPSSASGRVGQRAIRVNVSHVS
jgi:hypothetical protein